MTENDYPIAVAGATVVGSDEPLYVDLLNPHSGLSHRTFRCGGTENQPVVDMCHFPTPGTHPDYNLLGCANKDKILRVVDLNTYSTLHQFPHGTHIRCFSFLPPRLVISAASNSTWRVFDLDTSEVVKELTPDHTRQFNVTCFCAFLQSRALQRYRVASGNMDRRTPTVKIWDPSRWACLNTYRRPHPNGSVECLTYHAGLKVVLSGSEDGTIKFLDPGVADVCGTIESAKQWVKKMCLVGENEVVTCEAPFSGDLQYISCYDLRKVGQGETRTPLLWNVGIPTMGGDVIMCCVPFTDGKGESDDLVVAANDQKELILLSCGKEGEIVKKFTEMPHKFSALCGVPVMPKLISQLYPQQISEMIETSRVVSDGHDFDLFTLRTYPKLKGTSDALRAALSSVRGDWPSLEFLPPSIEDCVAVLEEFDKDVFEEVSGDDLYVTILGPFVQVAEPPEQEGEMEDGGSDSAPGTTPPEPDVLSLDDLGTSPLKSSGSLSLSEAIPPTNLKRPVGTTEPVMLREGRTFVRKKKRGVLRREIEVMYFEGTFSLSRLRHGRGTFYYDDGKTPSFTGLFVDGKREGAGQEFHENGERRFRGMFSDDRRHGRGMLYAEDGLGVEIDGFWQEGVCVKRKEESIKLQEVDYRSLRKQFTFENEIGRGGNGRVYKVKWHRRTCAAKVVDGVSKQSLGRHVLDESLKVLASLNHPNIIKVFGVFYDDQIGYVMEYCVKSIADMITPELDMAERLRILRDTAFGVRYLHHKDWLIMHRDLKWENVLLDPHGVVKITDFDFAKIDESKWRASKANHSVVGTLDFIAPEMWCNEPYSTSCDVYSFGIMMHIILFANLHPYEGVEHCTNPSCRFQSTKLTPASFAGHVVNCSLRPPLPPHYVEYDRRLIQLMKLCWHTDPSHRPSFIQIADVLEMIMTPEEPEAPVSPPTPVEEGEPLFFAAPTSGTPPSGSPPKLDSPLTPNPPRVAGSATPVKALQRSTLVRVCFSSQVRGIEEESIMVQEFSLENIRRILTERYDQIVDSRRQRHLQVLRDRRSEAAAAEEEIGELDVQEGTIEKLAARYSDGTEVDITDDSHVGLLTSPDVVLVVSLFSFEFQGEGEGEGEDDSEVRVEEQQRRLLENLQQTISFLQEQNDEKDQQIRQHLSRIRILQNRTRELEDELQKLKTPRRKKGNFSFFRKKPRDMT